MYNGFLIENVLSKEECQMFIDYVEKRESWNDWEQNDYWKNRVIHQQMLINDNTFESMQLNNLLNEIRTKIKNYIMEKYNLADRVYSDGIGIVRWPEGLEQPPHADQAMNDGSSNGLDWRDYGTVLYLNDNFEGGETYYPQYGISVKPKTGTLAIHPGGIDHLHGVSKVSGATRYTIASFWSKQQDHWDGIN